MQNVYPGHDDIMSTYAVMCIIRGTSEWMFVDIVIVWKWLDVLLLTQ